MTAIETAGEEGLDSECNLELADGLEVGSEERGVKSDSWGFDRTERIDGGVIC